MHHLLRAESLHDGSPFYPPLARQARIQGQVEIVVTVDHTGKVEDVRVVSGHPMLAPAAVETAKGWKFSPFVIDDKPTEVEANVKVNFKIAESPEEAARVFARDFDWRLKRAKELLAKNQPLTLPDAESNATEALELAHSARRPLEEGQAKLLLAQIHEADGEYSTKDYDDALALIRAAQEHGAIQKSSSPWVDAHYEAGLSYFRNQQFEAAEMALLSAVQSWRVQPSESVEDHARLAVAASMAAASSLRMNHPRSAAHACAIFRREKAALHGLQLDEATQRCSGIR